MVRSRRGASRRCLLLLAIAVPGLVATSASAGLVETRGTARDIDSGVVLYTEHHLLRSENDTPQERLVLYRCPDGRAFGRKTVVYNRDLPAAPVFALEDARIGYREGARRDADGLMTYADFHAGGEPEGSRVAETPDLAIDAGFDAYVRERWDALQAGTKLSVDFLVPSRGRAYAFHIRKLREDSIEGAPASVFRLRLAGLLGWLVPDMDVSYRNSDLRLMRFEGLTNIRIDADDLVAATIDFPAAEENPAPDPELWQALQNEPLTACALGES